VRARDHAHGTRGGGTAGGTATRGRPRPPPRCCNGGGGAAAARPRRATGRVDGPPAPPLGDSPPARVPSGLLRGGAPRPCMKDDVLYFHLKPMPELSDGRQHRDRGCACNSMDVHGHLGQLSVTGADTSRPRQPASTLLRGHSGGPRALVFCAKQHCPCAQRSKAAPRPPRVGAPPTRRGTSTAWARRHRGALCWSPARAPATGRFLAGRPAVPFSASLLAGPAPVRAAASAPGGCGGPPLAGPPLLAHNRLVGDARCTPTVARRLLPASRSLARRPWPPAAPGGPSVGSSVPRAVGPCRRPRGRARSGAGALKSAAMGRARHRRCATRRRPRRAGCC